MFPSRTVVTVTIGRHMEPGGGSESAGDAGAPGNKSERSQLLCRPSPPLRLCHKDLGGGDALNPLYLKRLIMGCGVFTRPFPGNVARKRHEVSHLPDRW